MNNHQLIQYLMMWGLVYDKYLDFCAEQTIITFRSLHICKLHYITNLSRDNVKSRKLQNSYQGSKFELTHCEGAIKSFEEAMTHVDPRKGKSFLRAIEMQIQRLVDGHRMSKENFPQEGELPKRKGQQKAKKFNALKRIPIRGYCWLSDKYPHKYFISHYVYKDYDKLQEADTKKVGANWTRIEVGNDEY